MIASTLALSQGLGLLTTAEGVEEVAQFEYVRNAGVDLVQGYLFGQPCPVSALVFDNLSNQHFVAVAA